jgi:hypothetical protein
MFLCLFIILLRHFVLPSSQLGDQKQAIILDVFIIFTLSYIITRCNNKKCIFNNWNNIWILYMKQYPIMVFGVVYSYYG